MIMSFVKYTFDRMRRRPDEWGCRLRFCPRVFHRQAGVLSNPGTPASREWPIPIYAR